MSSIKSLMENLSNVSLFLNVPTEQPIHSAATLGVTSAFSIINLIKEDMLLSSFGTFTPPFIISIISVSLYHRHWKHSISEKMETKFFEKIIKIVIDISRIS